MCNCNHFVSLSVLQIDLINEYNMYILFHSSLKVKCIPAIFHFTVYRKMATNTQTGYWSATLKWIQLIFPNVICWGPLWLFHMFCLPALKSCLKWLLILFHCQHRWPLSKRQKKWHKVADTTCCWTGLSASKQRGNSVSKPPC